VVDIGANIGYTVLAAGCYLGVYGKIHAFEPSPECLRLLHDNIYMNRMLGLLRPAVIVHPVAIGTAEGERTLSYTRLHLGRGSLNPLVEAQMQQERLPVERVTVDVSDARQIFDSIGQIRLVKIDVEGLEHEVLEALLPALSRGQIDYLDLEFGQQSRGGVVAAA
jgi:FkbM family methyltransferase